MTLTQKAIFRAVEGAIMNTFHAHPELGNMKRWRRSISKRAAGTLLAMSRTTLAGVTAQSESEGEACGTSPRRPTQAPAAGPETSPRTSRRLRLPHLRKLQLQIGIKAGEARRHGEMGKLEAYVEVLRMIAKLGA